MSKEANYDKQPAPIIQNEVENCWDLVIEEFSKRKKFGLNKYNIGVCPNDGRDTINDLIEELYDQCVYLKKHQLEYENIEKTLLIKLLHHLRTYGYDGRYLKEFDNLIDFILTSFLSDWSKGLKLELDELEVGSELYNKKVYLIEQLKRIMCENYI
jgi:hypothetical protein